LLKSGESLGWPVQAVASSQQWRGQQWHSSC